MTRGELRRTLAALGLFGVAFGYVEAAVVVYLRELYEPVQDRLFPDRLPASQRTMARKVEEARVAQLIEHKYSKRQILEMYLNEIYFGRGAYGVEAASREYFGKHASQLTLDEAALLAGLPRAPSMLNPRSNLDETGSNSNEVTRPRAVVDTARNRGDRQSRRTTYSRSPASPTASSHSRRT